MIQLKGAARRRTEAGVEAAAAIIGCKPGRMLAVIEVEAPRGPFDGSGRPTILFEPHVFFRCLPSGPKRSRAVAENLANPKWGAIPYGLLSSQYGKLERAMRIDETAALKACSWGSPQILGENHEEIGFETVQEMVKVFADDEDEQLRSMADFIVHKKLASYLKTGNWAKFAAGYNGPGYKKNAYDVKLAQADRKHSQVQLARGIADLPEEECDDDTSSVVVEAAQRRLRELGYASVGNPDGNMGSMAVGAVSAFQNDRGIEVTGRLDDATMAELDTACAEGWARPISAKRAEATANQIMDKVPEAQAAWKAKLGAYWQAAVGGVGFVISSLVQYAGDAWQATSEVRDIFAKIPTPVWFALAGGVALFMAYHARNAQKTSDAAYRTGQRV